MIVGNQIINQIGADKKSVRQLEVIARELGCEAFHNKIERRAVCHDLFNSLVEDCDFRTQLALSAAWYNGWDLANLAN